MAVMRPRLVAVILLACALGVGAWLWLGERTGTAPPADAFAARFAIERSSPPSPAMQRYVTRLRVADALAFSPSFIAAPQPLHPLGRVELAGDEGSRLAFAPPVSALPFVVSAPPAADIPLPRPRPGPRPFVPDDRVLDDAQIASLKERLKLTVGQERQWAPIEAELRGLQWRRPGPGRSGQPTLDPDALQRLKTAAETLMGSLREDQKREVRMLMGIVGL
jgi:hypothetical protein